MLLFILGSKSFSRGNPFLAVWGAAIWRTPMGPVTRDRSIRRRHPWILSGAIARVEGAETPGDWVQVRSAEGEILGYGLLSPESALRVRMLTIGKEAPADDLIAERIRLAVERRAANPLLGDTQAVRLVNAEGDGLPGLMVDRYADVVVVKMTAVGMQRRREQIAAVLRETTGAGVGFERADAAAARREGMSTEQGALWGTAPDGPFEICERDRRYRIDVVAGQKTGFYLDQRDSRDLVASLAAGRRVLDLFAYSGGFSVAAALGGASAVTLVESSAPALALAEENLAANAPGLTPDCALCKARRSRFLARRPGVVRSGRRGSAAAREKPPRRTARVAVL